MRFNLFWAIVPVFCVAFVTGCGASKVDVRKNSDVAFVRQHLPPDFAAGVLLKEGRNRHMVNIVNQYGQNLNTIREGRMFEWAVRDVFKTMLPNAHLLSRDSTQNIVVFIDGKLDMDAFSATYISTIRVVLFTTSGEIIGAMQTQGRQFSGLLNDETAVYNAYVKAATDAVIAILKNNPGYLTRMAYLPRIRLPREPSLGTGFFVDNQGTVLTNFHVVDNCQQVIIHYGGQAYAASQLIANRDHDLALIRIPVTAPSPSPGFISSPAALGQNVSVYGYGYQDLEHPDSEHPSFATGTLSYIGDDVFFHFTAPIHPGSSGSPVIGEDGNVIGIVSSSANPMYYAEQTGTLPQNINVAIGMAAISELMAQGNIQRNPPHAQTPVNGDISEDDDPNTANSPQDADLSVVPPPTDSPAQTVSVQLPPKSGKEIVEAFKDIIVRIECHD